jgi:hypothetical protein
MSPKGALARRKRSVGLARAECPCEEEKIESNAPRIRRRHERASRQDRSRSRRRRGLAMKSVVVTGRRAALAGAASRFSLPAAFASGAMRAKRVDADRLPQEFGVNFTPLIFDITDEATVAAGARVRETTNPRRRRVGAFIRLATRSGGLPRPRVLFMRRGRAPRPPAPSVRAAPCAPPRVSSPAQRRQYRRESVRHKRAGSACRSRPTRSPSWP